MHLQQKDMQGSNFNKGITLKTPERFCFTEALTYLSRSPQECLHKVKGEKVYKLFQIDGEPILIEVSDPGDGALHIRYVNNTPESHEQIRTYVTEWFDLKRNLAPFYALAERDDVLGPLVERYEGLRIIGVPELFEALCWAVIGQQVNLTFAYTVKKRLVEHYGDHFEWEGERYWLFPDAEAIARLTVSDLKELQLTTRKTEYLIHIARLMVDGELSKGKLLATGFEKAEETLCSIRGIGPWSAHYVMMRCLRDPAAFPIGDAGLQNALKHILQRDKKPEYEEMRRLFRRWQGWEAYAVFYLWRSLH